MPPEALSWNDADDNNGFHEKLFVMDFDGTLSTELAMFANKADLQQCHYHGAAAQKRRQANRWSRRSMRAAVSFRKVRRIVEVAKDFMRALPDEARGDEREHEGGIGPMGTGQR